jgi:hypothetical protein
MITPPPWTDPSPGEYPYVNEAHAGLLIASRVSVKVAEARGYLTATTSAMLKMRGFGQSQREHDQVPGLLVPLWNVLGEQDGFQYRPDTPRCANDGKPIKYETPRRMPMRLDVPPSVQQHLSDPSRTLLITEGVRKADALVTAGVDAIALLGVWSWRGRNNKGGLTALADWEPIALNGRQVGIVFDSDVMLKPQVHAALVRLGRFLADRGALVFYIYLPAGEGLAKVGIDDWLAAGNDIRTLPQLTRTEPLPPPGAGTKAKTARTDLPTQDGAALLEDVRAFVGRYCRLPSDEALTAVALWAAHTHLIDTFESTPRLALLSAEPASGKTRVLEVLALLVPRPVPNVSTTPAALFRMVAGEAGPPTILFDEIDTIFGPRAKPAEELRGLVNAGHRRGASAYRCVGEGTAQTVQAFPAYAAMALAGLGNLPDTVATRSIVIPMRPRLREEEPVTPFRTREAEPPGYELRDRLAVWAEQVRADAVGYVPEMPAEVTDRPADVWEPLLTVAELAGGDWPERARTACRKMVRSAVTDRAESSLGVRLLHDIREILNPTDSAPLDEMTTEALLRALGEDKTAPWVEICRGDPINARKLASLLRPYGIKSENLRPDAKTQQKGYRRSSFVDAWRRYLPEPDGTDWDSHEHDPPPSAENPSHPSQPSPDEDSRRSEDVFGGTDGGTDSAAGTDRSVPTTESVPPSVPVDEPLTSRNTGPSFVGTDGTGFQPGQAHNRHDTSAGPTEADRETAYAARMGLRPLRCDICGVTGPVVGWAAPYWVVRCIDHDPEDEIAA